MALFSVVDAAKELGVSRSTLYALVRRRAIPHVKIGDRVLLNLEKIIAALEIEAENSDRPCVVRPDARRKAQGNQ